MCHGDEIELAFSSPAPPLPGFTRHVFLLANVWYSLKEHPFGPLTGVAAPLPFAGIKSYPYDPEQWPYKNDRDYLNYQKTWNTRRVQ